jgi:perosamine synthetase
LRKTIHINLPLLDDQEVQEVTKVLKSSSLTSHSASGSMVRRFESVFAVFVGAKHAVAVNNGTAALHMAVLAAQVEPNGEVILPSFTFTATAEAVALAGAKPVFVDINPKTYNIDPQKIEALITKNTKAIIAVDLYGLPADMLIVKEIAKKHDLAVIEDSAQAHGAVYREKPIGSFSDMTCWSFYATKNMTTGEGGMVTTNNDDFAERLRCIRTHGEKEGYKSIMLGHNYRMPEIEAAIGHVQLKKLPGFLEKRRQNATLLTRELSSVKRLQLPVESEECKHAWYLYTVRVLDNDPSLRDTLMKQLRERNIESAVYYSPPIHLMPYYRRFGEYRLPETEKAAKQVLSLPVNPDVTAQEIGYVANSLIESLEEATP